MMDESDPVNDRSSYGAQGDRGPPGPASAPAGHLCRFLGGREFPAPALLCGERAGRCVSAFSRLCISLQYTAGRFSFLNSKCPRKAGQRGWSPSSGARPVLLALKPHSCALTFTSYWVVAGAEILKIPGRYQDAAPGWFRSVFLIRPSRISGQNTSKWKISNLMMDILWFKNPFAGSSESWSSFVNNLFICKFMFCCVLINSSCTYKFLWRFWRVLLFQK